MPRPACQRNAASTDPPVHPPQPRTLSMNRLLTMPRLTILFVTLFAVAMGGVMAYRILVTDVGERCEAGGRWWDPATRTCAQPIAIAEITGRLNDQTRAEASDQKNRELIAIEDDLAAQKAARDAEIDRQRAVMNARP